MSIPTHTELATSQEKAAQQQDALQVMKWEWQVQDTHPRKFLPSIKGNTKWKLLLSGKRNSLDLWKTKTAGILGLESRKTGTIPHHARTSRNQGWTGRWKGANSFKWAISLLGHNYSVLWRSFTIAATLGNIHSGNPKGSSFRFSTSSNHLWKMQPLLRSNSDGREGTALHNLWHGHMVRKAHGWFGQVYLLPF